MRKNSHFSYTFSRYYFKYWCGASNNLLRLVFLTTTSTKIFSFVFPFLVLIDETTQRHGSSQPAGSIVAIEKQRRRRVNLWLVRNTHVTVHFVKVVDDSSSWRLDVEVLFSKLFPRNCVVIPPPP